MSAYKRHLKTAGLGPVNTLSIHYMCGLYTSEYNIYFQFINKEMKDTYITI